MAEALKLTVLGKIMDGHILELWNSLILYS